MNSKPTAVARTFASVLAVAAVVASAPGGAQKYPVKPVRVLVGFAPGGGIDIATRSLAPALGARLATQVIVDNRPGAGSNIAAAIAAKAPSDGYTLLLGTIAALAINPALYRKLPFDPVADFAPITQTGTMSNILVVHPVLPARTVKEFVALAKQQPGQINWASPGAGSSAHLAGELLRKAARIDIVHVPYKGGGQAVVDVIAGHVPAFFGAVPVVMSHVAAGRLRAIAVTTGKRASAMPEVPTVAESGFAGFEVNNWYGLVAPVGTPQGVIKRLNTEVMAALQSPDVTKRLRHLGHDVATSTPEEFDALIKSEKVRWAKIVREAGIKAR